MRPDAISMRRSGSQRFQVRQSGACSGDGLAAIDRLVHDSTIFELNNVGSYRGKQAARDQKVQRDNDKANRRRQSSSDNDNNPTGNIFS